MSRIRLAPIVLLTAAFGLAGCAAEGGGGSSSAVRALAEPTVAFPEDFGTIQTVRELTDGTVLVADPLSNALYRVDMDAGTRTVIGREGEGPGEYQQPDAVWALPGDGTLLVDLGNARLARLGADLSFGETSQIMVGEFQPGAPLVLALPQTVDGRGMVYARAMGGGFGGELPDSAAILRIDVGAGAVDTVASFKLQDRTQTTSGGPNNQNVSIQSIPLSAEDAWGAAADGSVVVARSADYHVEWFHPDGTVTRGPATPFETVAIGTPEKEEFVAAQGRGGGGVGISVMVDNGAVQMGFSRGGPGSRRREIDNYTWPETKPPFYSGRIDVDPQGRAWIRRHVAAGADATYDIFDGTGARVGTVTLANNKRVIGFGAGSVYVVAYDEVDLNYLERYEMPTL